VTKVTKEIRGTKVRKVILELKESKVFKVKLGPLVKRVIPEPKEFKV
tara:strand:+ start:450 stop:590 length:141 start_codon:yes stop_codon:yes gene_type:complete